MLRPRYFTNDVDSIMRPQRVTFKSVIWLYYLDSNDMRSVTVYYQLAKHDSKVFIDYLQFSLDLCEKTGLC